MTASLILLLLAADPGAVMELPSVAEHETVPAMTPVYVKLDEEVSSKRHKTGDRFRILVAEDVRIGEHVVIPAGAAGEGEVIHAAKAGLGGKAGELLLAARYIKVGDVDVPLRSMALGRAGTDHMNETLAASFVIGPFAMFVHGGAVIVPRDALASAKTAVEIELPVQAAPVSPTVPVDATKGEPADENKPI